MAELKRNFLKSRMNKDADERLVSNGEYRDALNIEISKSESSNAGSVQNKRGNLQVDTLDYEGNPWMRNSNSNNALTVGSIPSESTSAIYNFI